MTDSTNIQPLNQDQLNRTLTQLRQAFPDLETIALHEGILRSPHLPHLARLVKLSIPIDAYHQQLMQLYQQITEIYYQNMLGKDKKQQCEKRKSSDSSEIVVSNDMIQLPKNEDDGAKQVVLIRSKISYKDLANYIANFSEQKETEVSSQLIQMCRAFNSWPVKEISAPQLSKGKFQKKEPKFESEKKIDKERSPRNDNVKIMLGTNISLQCKQMRHQIINRAKSNKLLEENTRLTQLQKIGIEINYILNRITEEYFQDFLEELKPYAQDQIYSFVLSDKIIEKVLDEHNFINIYCELVYKLKNVKVLLGGDKQLRFKNIFVERLQQSFYSLVRGGEWQGREQLYKKQLIGMSSFVGQLFNIHYLSKYIFKDCFYELVRSYVTHYQKYKSNKSVFYFETYIECVIKIVQKMSRYYEELMEKKNIENLEQVLNELLKSSQDEDFNFTHICDFIELLKMINERLPSQRFKITFLLEDFRCSKILKKEKETLNNSEFEIMKSLLSIDINSRQDVKRIPDMLSRGNSQILMKDFFYQFAEGNLKQVNKHIELFKVMAGCPGIVEATIKSLKDNIEGLYIIESDFPFLCEGLAKVLKIICDEKRVSLRDLSLGEQESNDQDLKQFFQKIEERYYKMIMQD